MSWTAKRQTDGGVRMIPYLHLRLVDCRARTGHATSVRFQQNFSFEQYLGWAALSRRIRSADSGHCSYGVRIAMYVQEIFMPRTRRCKLCTLAQRPSAAA
ncbi:hypothetical protein LshimejAT787_0602540 [Lyophyllum shimeji]|uniref:Uncharacterized protein n=1 Tax=Lyophyllum shimeji TaxID=47721 RepID=A0A9P3PPN1_LYOSH|nr:hypothetical protein LshimejAT787_0602540 [Lyophyllum shimeji]